MRYGLPYMGSKSRIADWIVKHLPSGGTLYDVFAGGCAITHYALLNNRWDKIVCNDITDSVRLFVDAIHGKYKDCNRWVSRDEFFREKDHDPFVRILWSFGNNQSDYLYSKDVEPYKKSLHRMLFAKSVQERRVLYKTVFKELQKITASERTSNSLESLERLQSLESSYFEVCQGDYASLKIDNNRGGGYIATHHTKERQDTPQISTTKGFTIG